MIQVELERVQGDFGFAATDSFGRTLAMDTGSEGGGNDSGIRPMQTILMALGGCSGIDIVSILKKQRQEIRSFSMSISGEREQGKQPSLWKAVHVQFRLAGRIDPQKAVKACTISLQKYCSVAETLRRAGAKITWNVEVNDTND